MTRSCTKAAVVLLISSLFTICDSYRILGVFPMMSRSHYFLGSSLIRGLAEAGHDVTFITSFSDENLFKSNGSKGSLREIFLDDMLANAEERMKNMGQKGSHKASTLAMLKILNTMSATVSEGTLKHPKVQQLINSGEEFDVVIVSEFMTDSLKGLSAHFNAHLVGFSNHVAFQWIHEDIGTPLLPSFTPNTFSSFSVTMNFYQRFINTMLTLALKLNDAIVQRPVQREIHSKYFPNNPELDVVTKNVSLMLVNSQTGSLFYALPSVPVMVEVGGLHVRSTKTLPADLKKVLDEAKDGVIYFSMGSFVKSENLPTKALQALMKVFSKRKETVLFKYGNDTLSNKPDNVQLGKWFPQQEILAHPNVKAFVTHGGFLSTTETIYHGVPILALPVLGDQKMNAERAMKDGYGLTVNIEELTEETFGSALLEITSNPSYLETARQKSAIFKDRRHKPIDEAVYWVEYVVKHKGAKHLRVAYADMPWYQYYLLDVIALCIGIISAILLLIKKSVCFVIRRVKGKEQVSISVKKVKRS